jgi:hypothetical protein
MRQIPIFFPFRVKPKFLQFISCGSAAADGNDLVDGAVEEGEWGGEVRVEGGELDVRERAMRPVC